MRSASAGMVSHLTLETTTLAWCWKVTRKDGQVFGFTTHDRDLVFGGVTYSAESSMSASAAQAKAGASVDNLDIMGYVGSPAITEADLMAGLWDNAAIELRVVNWNDTTQSVILQTGTIGQIKLVDGQYVAEMRSLSQALQQPVGRSMSRRCDAVLGDAQCGVALAAYTVSGTVSAVTSRQVFAATNLPASAGGLLTWTSGANVGRAMEVKTATAGTITLALPMTFDIAVSDAYSVTAGCDKNMSTCQAVYNNVINFRGFPHIPGVDAVYAYPDAK